jgi:lysophospholipase L1-like esterase
MNSTTNDDDGLRWVTAWQSPPTDAATPGDASLTPLLAGPFGQTQSFRVVLSPLGEGHTIRIHLSNRYGAAPVIFAAVSVAHRLRGAVIDPATNVPVLFDGSSTVTVGAGRDVVSDAVGFTVAPFDDLAVTVDVAEPGNIPTHHFTARQTSYATLPGVRTGTDAAAFTQTTTLRPYVVGLDVVSDDASAVVTFGDSITDGFQGPASLLPQDTATIDLNQRYPDYLKRRIDAAGLPFFVSNAGISGNRVCSDGDVPALGPAAGKRVDTDVLAQCGVGTVIWMEGINDIGLTSRLTVDRLAEGYTATIGKLHQRGLTVLHGTLTPSGGNSRPSYGVLGQDLRRGVNQWIRTKSPADAVIDFEAAVRDPANPDHLDARYDGGDGLHFNPLGYQRLAEAVDLDLLAGAP